MAREGFVKLTLCNDITYLPIVQLCVRETARKYGFAGDDLSRIELAVEEAVSNVIEHAFETDEDSTFEIICRRIPTGMKITIKENGIPFDPEQMPRYDPLTVDEGGSAAGLGMYLLRECMDEVAYVNLGPGGKETCMTKHLAGKNIEDYFPPGELRPAAHGAAATSAETVKIPYSVRLMATHEAIEISKGAYKSHGYTFFDEHIYYPEQIIAMNKAGELVSAVAVTDDNRFMGHAALLYPRPESEIAEFTFAFVNPEYRGQGCLNRLSEFLFRKAGEIGLAGIYSYAVANHPFTQKAMLKYGMKDCGIELGTSPCSWIFKGIEGDVSQRISVVLSFTYVGRAAPLLLYPPAHHREMIMTLYANLGAHHDFREPGPPDPGGAASASAIETVIHSAEGSADIFIRSCGSDIVRSVRGILRDLCMKQISSITLLQSLEDPAAAVVTREFEALGFFFSGILPHTVIGDALILQYLNNVPFDYDKVVAYSPVAQDILAYIRDRDPNRER